MKKCTLLVLISALLCSFLPQTAVAQTTDKVPALIYLDKNFEAQELGEGAYGFYIPKTAFYKYFSVATAEKDKNAENKAMMVVGNGDGGYIRHTWHHAPITKDFVIDFNIKLQETAIAKNMYLYKNAVLPRNTRYLDAGASFSLMSLTDKMTVNNKAIPGITFSAGRWYNIIFAINTEKKTIDVYVDGKNYGSVLMPDFINISEWRITSPAVGGDYYIDDISIYEASEIMDEELYQEELTAWKNSPLCPDEKYEVGRLYRYDKYVYRALYNKFLARIGSNKVYKDNTMHQMSGPILEQDDMLIAPVRGIADVFGAETQWDAALNKLTLTYQGKTMEVITNENIYYVNGKPSKLFYPATIRKGTLYLQLNVLTHFFGAEYRREEYLLNFGDEITFDRDFGPMVTNAHSRTFEEEIMMRINLFMVYDRPTKEELLEKYRQTNPEGKHPRVILKDFDEIKTGMEKEEAFASLINTLIGKADNAIDAGTVVYTLPDGQRASFSGKLYTIGVYCSLAYKITGEQKYMDFINDNINIIDTEFPDLHPIEGLDVGNSANGLGPIYDWLYDDLEPDVLEALERIIIEMVFEEYEYSYAHAYYNAQTAFAANSGNQPLIINNGLIGCAIALMDKYPEQCAELLECAIRSVEQSYLTFAPDGGFPEGLSYWLYTCDTLPYTLANLQCAFGDDFGLSEVPGLDNTVYYALSSSGSTGGYPLGDAAVQSPYHPMFMWHANYTGDKSIAQLRKENMSSASLIDAINWVFDTEGTDSGLENIEGDSLFVKLNTAAMRTGWEKSDTSVILHGGGNNDPHGHLDVGTFQFDMLGERWADETPKEDYNLTGYGAYNKDDAVPGHPYGSKDYYRNKAEGHNTVIAGLGTTRYDMVTTAQAPIVKHAFGDTMSYAIVDLTESNENYECAVRGLQLDKVQNHIIVQDNFKAATPMEFWWFMHTKADIELSEDKKSAILSMNNKRIWASIISDGDETFQILDAKPMREYTIDGVTYPPPLQTANNGYRKLAVQNESTDNFKLTVVFKPLVGESDAPDVIPENVPMEQWQPVEAERAQLLGVTVDGVAYEEFSPGVYNYNLDVVTEKSDIPKIAVTADEDYEVEVIESTTVPGVTSVIMSKDGVNVGMYTFSITPLNDTTKFLNDRQIPIVGYTVSSEPQPENGAANLFDANDATKFATDEIGGAVTVDFGEVKTVKEIMMSFVSGASRQEYFKIEYSADGANFTECYDGSSSGTTTDYESYDIGSVPARYIRVSFYGNNKGANWVSVKEFCAFTE